MISSARRDQTLIRADRALVFGAAAAESRRDLSAMAWLVLEELALGAGRDGCTVSSVRSLGSALGSTKDTMARALRQLSVHGLVTRDDLRDRGGRFGHVVYRVDLAAAGITVIEVGPSAESVNENKPNQPNQKSNIEIKSETRKSTKRETGSTIDQLELFKARTT